MAVIKCREVLEGRSGGVDEAGNTTLTRMFSVETDNPADSPAKVIAGLRYDDPDTAVPLGSVPILQYDYHPDYRPARLREARCSATNSPTAWLVSLDYRSAPFPARQGGLPTTEINPASPPQPSNSSSTGTSNARPAPERPPEYTFSNRQYTLAGEFYVNQAAGEVGNKAAYVNSVGDQLEGLEVQRANLVITIKYFTTKMTTAKMRERLGAINDTPWQGYDAGSLKVMDIGLESVYDLIGYDGGGQEIHGLLWRCSITLEESREGWQTTVLNAGRRYKPATGPNAGKLLAATNADGTPATEPVPLKADGDLAATPADFHYRTFLDQRRINFGASGNPLLI